MDPVKEAFIKIKEEMLLLKNEISLLTLEINLLKTHINTQTIPTNIQTIMSHPTDNTTQNPTVPQEMMGLKVSKEQFSTGNDGVPTDNQSYTQTIQQAGVLDKFIQENTTNPLLNIQFTLENLDAIKKELRLKFKKLTPQEMMVFSTLYGLESQGFDEISYKIIANNLNLSESSIRDYIHKILQKGIPIIKTRLNNKKIILKISPDLKKIASLSTITKLRDI